MIVFFEQRLKNCAIAGRMWEINSSGTTFICLINNNGESLNVLIKNII